MGNFTSQPPASQPEPEREYFTDAGKSYFGPNFIVHPATSNSSNPSAHFLDPKNLLWSDIWSTVATGRALTLKQLEEFGNPYTSKNAQATTLQSLTNLKKTSFKISNNDSIQKIEFSFDSSTPCLVRIYQNVKEVVVVDTRTGTSVKNIVFRSFDNSTPKLSTFGPFNHGLNQKFSQELHLIDSLPMIPTSTTIAAEGGDSSPGKMEPQNETQSSQEQLFTIQLFPLIIVLESIVPSLIEGLEKAAKQGMPNPVNSQSTYINYSIINDSISDLKVLKQRVLVIYY